MKGKNIIRIICLTLFIFYFVLYISQAFGYYEYSNRKMNQMTEQEVDRFEKDLSEGKEIDASNYIKKENDYSNKISKMGIGVSNFISYIFDHVMNYIFKEVDNTVNSK